MDKKFKISLLTASVFMAASVSAVAAENTTTFKPADILAPEQVSALGEVVANGKDASEKNKAQTLAETAAADRSKLSTEQQAALDSYNNNKEEIKKATLQKDNATAATELLKGLSDVTGTDLYTKTEPEPGSVAFDSADPNFVVTSTTATEHPNFVIINPFTPRVTLGEKSLLKAYNDALDSYVGEVAGVYTAAKNAVTDVKTAIDTDADLAKKVIAVPGISSKKLTDKDKITAWIISATGDAETSGVQALGKTLAYYSGMDRWETVVQNVNALRGTNIDDFINNAREASKDKTSTNLSALGTALAGYDTAITNDAAKTAGIKSWKDQGSDPAAFVSVVDALKEVLAKAQLVTVTPSGETVADDAVSADSPLGKLLSDASFTTTVANPIDNLQKAATGIKSNTDDLGTHVTAVTAEDLATWKETMQGDKTRPEKEEATRALLNDYMNTLIAVGKLSNNSALATALTDAVKGYQGAKTKLDTAQSRLTTAQSLFRSQYIDYLAKKAGEVTATEAYNTVESYATDHAEDPGIKEQIAFDTALNDVRTEVKTLTGGLFNIADPSINRLSPASQNGLQNKLIGLYQAEMAKFTTAAPSDTEKQQLIINLAKALAYEVPADTSKAVEKGGVLYNTVNAAKEYYLNKQLGSEEKTSDLRLKAITELATTADDGSISGTNGAQAVYDQSLATYNKARTAFLDLLTADALQWQTDITNLSRIDMPSGKNVVDALAERLPTDDRLALEKARADLLLAANTGDTTTTAATLGSLLTDDHSTLKTAADLNKKGATTTFAAYKDLERAKQTYTDSFASALNVGSMAGQAADIYGKLQSWNTGPEQEQAYINYNSLFAEHFSQTLPALADQKDATKNPDHLAKTLYLGGLSAGDLATLDANGDLKKLSVKPEKPGATEEEKIASRLKFTEEDLYTGDKDHRMTTTALNIEVPKVTVRTLDDLAKQELHTLTVGGSDAKSMLDVYTKTYYASDSYRQKPAVLADKQRYLTITLDDYTGAAVLLRGDLKIATKASEEAAAIRVNEVAADKLVLQNINIDNSVSMADLMADNGLQRARVMGLVINTDTVQTVPVIADPPGQNPDYGMLKNKKLPTAPEKANIELKNVNITVNNAGLPSDYSELLKGSEAIAIALAGNANHLSITGNGKNVITASAAPGAKAYALLFADGARDDKGKTIESLNNVVDISGMQITGDITDNHDRSKDGKVNTNTVNLIKSVFTGDVESESSAAVQGSANFLALTLKDSHWTGSSSRSPDVTIDNGSWDLTGSSSVNFLTLEGSNTINMTALRGTNTNGDESQFGKYSTYTLEVEQDLKTTAPGSQTVVKIGSYSKDDAHLSGNYGFADDYRYGSITVDHLITGGGKLALTLANSGAEPTKDRSGTMLATPGHLADVTPHAFVTYLTKETRKVKDSEGKETEQEVSSAGNIFSSSPVAELGVWQYQPKEFAGKDGKTRVYFVSNGQLSNSAATVASLAAAPASVAAMESDALDKHISSLRHSDSSGVWLSYYGGSNKNSLKSGPEYRLKTNGVMLGADASFAQQWLAGVAFTSGKSSLSVLGSSGDLNNYGVQFWLSRIYENGVFVNGGAQFGHYSNSAKVRMQNGDQARGDYAINGYGLNVKLGYNWQNAGFYAEPYVQADARAFSGASYKLNNGMLVNSTDYKSFSGEIGTDLGYTVPTSSGYFKPYLHLAVLNEFASDNHITVNNIRLPNSINGAAFRVGVGGEVKLMQNLGGYASFDYTKGSDIERPWQVNLGINYTW